MANPTNRGYALTLWATDDPDVVRVVESDDVEGAAPARNVSAVEAGRLWAAKDKPAAKPKPPPPPPPPPPKPVVKPAVKKRGDR